MRICCFNTWPYLKHHKSPYRRCFHIKSCLCSLSQQIRHIMDIGHMLTIHIIIYDTISNLKKQKKFRSNRNVQSAKTQHRTVQTNQNSVSVSAPKLTYIVVSVTVLLWWQCISALSVFGQNCYTGQPKVAMGSNGRCQWLQSRRPCMDMVSDRPMLLEYHSIMQASSAKLTSSEVGQQGLHRAGQLLPGHYALMFFHCTPNVRSNECRYCSCNLSSFDCGWME